MSEDKTPSATPPQAQDSAAMVAGAYRAAANLLESDAKTLQDEADATIDDDIIKYDLNAEAGELRVRAKDTLALTPHDALAALEAVKREARIEEAESICKVAEAAGCPQKFLDWLWRNNDDLRAKRDAAIRAQGGSR